MPTGTDTGGIFGGDSGIFGSNGFFARAARTIGNVFETGAEFVASLPNEIIDFGRGLGEGIFGGASGTADRLAEPFQREGAEFVEREAGIRGAGFLRQWGPLIILGALIWFLIRR